MVGTLIARTLVPRDRAARPSSSGFPMVGTPIARTLVPRERAARSAPMGFPMVGTPIARTLVPRDRAARPAPIGFPMVGTSIARTLVPRDRAARSSSLALRYGDGHPSWCCGSLLIARSGHGGVDTPVNSDYRASPSSPPSSSPLSSSSTGAPGTSSDGLSVFSGVSGSSELGGGVLPLPSRKDSCPSR